MTTPMEDLAAILTAAADKPTLLAELGEALSEAVWEIKGREIAAINTAGWERQLEFLMTRLEPCEVRQLGETLREIQGKTALDRLIEEYEDRLRPENLNSLNVVKQAGVDGNTGFVLVSEGDAGHWLEWVDSRAGAVRFIDMDEYPDDWIDHTLVDLSTGLRYDVTTSASTTTEISEEPLP